MDAKHGIHSQPSHMSMYLACICPHGRLHASNAASYLGHLLDTNRAADRFYTARRLASSMRLS